MISEKFFIVIQPSFVVLGHFEFHISRQARNKYAFDQTIFQLKGNVLLGSYSAAQAFAQKMNAARPPEEAVLPGQLFAMGLIDEILHMVAALYRQQVRSTVFAEALEWLEARLEYTQTDFTLIQFSDEFPPVAVYNKETSLTAYYKDSIDGIPNRQIVLEEMLMLWLANLNPAFDPFNELFDDSYLARTTAYDEAVNQLTAFFGYQPKFGPNDQTLIEMLRAPALASPDSLSGQLDYILENWGELLTELLGERFSMLLLAVDYIKEEQQVHFGGPGPALLPDFSDFAEAPENFSPDLDWMPSLVLIAKNAYVWLDQLSNKYDRKITRLDHIPDEELDTLASWGITGLWLIGVWERSPASLDIKRRMGAYDAEASAYSLQDYVVADDLGGPDAAADLRRRAWERGIRLGSDMVPNHMGIDSNWIVEHPDWFLGLDQPPFPAYSFDGPDLSHQDGISVYLEDHYYDKSDAAVVFKYVNYYTGQTRYIYHGNDGTNMPWNDTAQLDYLNPQVREAVIQTILHVARQFSVIRFDAAMTLAKQHIQRLWFPSPGKGGVIPSRASHGLPQDEFDRLIPVEFWREVVDRVAQEAPDTLLLAEAFWMMESFFVRTLGMHRVYNSAFMHMLRDEDNAKYRDLLKKTLEFNPQILKRYVNFMNNPDEDTAAEQFGKGDKYFGICTIMVTLPGLPMFGHGQFEGFNEKYGMEYRRAKLDEQIDEGFLTHHQRVIAPLLHRRRLFAEVNEFLLYDFFTGEGRVDENVFAYSNCLDGDRSLVVYHNRHADTKGWIKSSAAYTLDGGDSLIQKTLAEGLGLPNQSNAYLIFRDNHTNLEYLRDCHEIHQQGLYIELGAYQAQVFLDLQVVYDDPYHPYHKLADYLGGRAVPSVEDAMQEMHFQDIHSPYRQLVNPGSFDDLIAHALKPGSTRRKRQPVIEAEEKYTLIIGKTAAFAHGKQPQKPLVKHTIKELEAALDLRALVDKYPLERSRKYAALQTALLAGLEDHFSFGVLLGWVFTHNLGQVTAAKHPAKASRDWIDGWYLHKIISRTLQDLGADPGRADYGVEFIRRLTGQEGWFNIKAAKKRKPYLVLQTWVEDESLHDLLGVNEYKDILWFNQQALKEWLWWMRVLAVVRVLADSKIKKADKPKAILDAVDILIKIEKAVPDSDFQVERLIKLVNPDA